MKNKNNLTEEDKFKIQVDKDTLNDPTKTKELGKIQTDNPNVEFDLGDDKKAFGLFEDEIEPQTPKGIKYLSNVKDHKTGKISQPFTIAGKKYQMVRGITPKKEKVLGVYSFDELNKGGENIIHPIEEFENNIAKPQRLRELENQEPNQNTNTDSNSSQGTNLPKLQTDVKKLCNLIKTRFNTALSKLDKPLEQVQFLEAMAEEIGIPSSKLGSLISQFRDISKSGNGEPQAVNEHKIVTKKELIKIINSKKKVLQ